jgi:parallel beta-helix repeat protein
MLPSTTRIFLGALLGAVYLLSAGATGAAAQVVVSNTDNGGAGSLRAAILHANQNPGTTIQFNVPGPPPGQVAVRIQPTTALPAITGAGTIVDGNSQTAFAGNTNPAGPEVILDGSQIGGNAYGLVIQAPNCIVRGLVIGGFGLAGIRLLGAAGCHVRGCYLGTDEVGTTPLPNLRGIDLASGASGNTVGGTSAGFGNVISGNTGQAVRIAGAGVNDNLVRGNCIGMDPQGVIAVPNGGGGVLIQGGAQQNTVGGTTTTARNVISGNLLFGIKITGAGTDGNVVSGNYVGLDKQGADRMPNNGTGITIEGGAKNSVVGGTAGAGSRNVIAGNIGNGVAVGGAGTDGTAVLGNYVGLGTDGSTGISNQSDGILIYGGAKNTLVGGTAAAARNVSSANTGNGVLVTGSATLGTVVQGNYLGTNAAGTGAAGNRFAGVSVSKGAVNTLIGGDVSGARNVASGNLSFGIYVADPGTKETLVQGNYAGTDKGGTFAVPNAYGAAVSNAGPTTIGGTTALARNLFSGNHLAGVYLVTTTGCVVRGNYVGTNAAGAAALPNLTDGVVLHLSPANLIGGTEPGSGNLISGNGGHGIELSGTATKNNQVFGNRIGTNAAGSSAVSNGKSGVLVAIGAKDNAIGGADGGNQISGNQADGVTVRDQGTNGNKIQGNLIGTNAAGTGALGNAHHGINLRDKAKFAQVGGPLPALGNVISGNKAEGILVWDFATDSHVIEGNRIGVNAAGTAAVPNNFSGIHLAAGAQYCVVGGPAGAGNVISGNKEDGVRITPRGTNNNVIRGNVIGLDLAGNEPIPNGLFGVAMRADFLGMAKDAVLGNVISGNGKGGVLIDGPGSDHVVAGNYIGTDAAGSSARPNGGPGIRISNVAGCTLGGTLPGDGNVISGNDGSGIEFGPGEDPNRVFGNYIGTDHTGLAALPNARHGIWLAPFSRQAKIGGAAEERRNVISGNARCGILISGPLCFAHEIAGNYVGLDKDGALPLGNGEDGIRLETGATQNLIGGSVPAARNVVSGNALNGIAIRGAGTGGTVVRGNFIGTDAAATVFVPNGAAGVQVSHGAASNLIGGGNAALGNLIAGNGADGILVRDATTAGTQIRANPIFANGGLGINLEASGAVGRVTPNDAGDPDKGPNGLQNFPGIGSITLEGSTKVVVTLIGFAASSTFTVDLFRSDAPDESGHGEGQFFLGSKSVTTNFLGNASVTFILPVEYFGQWFAATATASATGDTSEFGPAVKSPDPPGGPR